MKIVKTRNSIYEIDEVNKKARRLNGINNPTFRFNVDNKWRGYEGLKMEINQPMLITWEIGVGDDGANAEVIGGNGGDDELRLRTTMTSRITSIEDVVS